MKIFSQKNCFSIGPKHLSTPIYLYNDHESRHLVLQQLVRVGEIFNSTKINQANSTFASNLQNQHDQTNDNSNGFAISFLSFNMYKFNYEIGKKEYIINGKNERRIRRIKEQHIEDREEESNCYEVNV